MASREGYDQSKADPRAWLYGIATNLLRRHFRQELRGMAATARRRQRSPSTGPTQVDAQARIGRLAAGIAALNQDDRDVLLLTAWAGLDSTSSGVCPGCSAAPSSGPVHS